MPGFSGTSPHGMGAMTGGGRGFCNPIGRGAAFRSYGSFRGGGYRHPYYRVGPEVSFSAPFTHQMTHEQKIEFLKNQVQSVKEQMEQLESRIQQLVIDTKDESKE